MKKKSRIKIAVWTLVLTMVAAVIFYGAYLFWLRNTDHFLQLDEATVACVDFDAVARNAEFFEERGFAVKYEDNRCMRVAYETGITEVYILFEVENDSYRLPFDGDVYVSWATPRLHYRSECIGKFEFMTAIQGENSYMNVYHAADNPWKGLEELDTFIQQLFADLAAYEAAK